ncbi:MAG: LPS export ABC transporter permease LptG [Hyphomicrobiales bacterium]|nr:LPS export ABC transporter permease LptG [Hyphomicrobiales bacterium]
MTAISTLGRYMSKRFLLAIVSVFFLCYILIFFIDFIEILREGGKKGGASTATLAFITFLRLPAFTELIMPFAVLIGSMGAFLMFSRSSELIIIRSSGVSVWQFLQPGLLVALIIGVAAITVYNPLAAKAKAYSEKLYAESFGADKSVLSKRGGGAWLRQDGADGQSIIYAKAVANRGISLAGVSLLQFDSSKKFLERIEAQKATLKNGYWQLENAQINSGDGQSSFHKQYLVSTYLTPEQATESIGSLESISFWELPRFIEFAERAGLSSDKYKLYYQSLLAKPLLMAAMVLVAATCTLRAFRFGKIQTMVITGLTTGFGFFIFSELSRKLGSSGLVSAQVAAWAPILIATFLALTVLLKQEDG